MVFIGIQVYSSLMRKWDTTNLIENNKQNAMFIWILKLFQNATIIGLFIYLLYNEISAWLIVITIPYILELALILSKMHSPERFL